MAVKAKITKNTLSEGKRYLFTSESVTEGENGLAQTLYDQLKRNYNIED